MPEEQVEVQWKVSDVEELQKHILPPESEWPPELQALSEEMKQEVRLRQAMQVKMLEMARRVVNEGISFSWDDLSREMNQIAKEISGVEYGVPLPSMYEVSRPMVMARGGPLSRMPLNYRTSLEEELSLEHRAEIRIRNSWHMLGDQEVCIVDTKEGPMVWPRWDAGTRLRRIMDCLHLRAGMALNADVELKAIECLRKKINGNQFNSYMLNGVFPEKSDRSDIHYFFRKGFPTLAVSFHGEKNKGGRVLAALCLHPLGYYSGSMVGLMCPTDEVICHLLMMRGDEPKYWAKCGQWRAEDTRSGI